jgi:hypothetical protein
MEIYAYGLAVVRNQHTHNSDQDLNGYGFFSFYIRTRTCFFFLWGKAQGHLVDLPSCAPVSKVVLLLIGMPLHAQPDAGLGGLMGGVLNCCAGMGLSNRTCSLCRTGEALLMVTLTVHHRSRTNIPGMLCGML